MAFLVGTIGIAAARPWQRVVPHGRRPKILPLPGAPAAGKMLLTSVVPRVEIVFIAFVFGECDG